MKQYFGTMNKKNNNKLIIININKCINASDRIFALNRATQEVVWNVRKGFRCWLLKLLLLLLLLLILLLLLLFLLLLLLIPIMLLSRLLNLDSWWMWLARMLSSRPLKAGFIYAFDGWWFSLDVFPPESILEGRLKKFSDLRHIFRALCLKVCTRGMWKFFQNHSLSLSANRFEWDTSSNRSSFVVASWPPSTTLTWLLIRLAPKKLLLDSRFVKAFRWMKTMNSAKKRPISRPTTISCTWLWLVLSLALNTNAMIIEMPKIITTRKNRNPR